MTDLFLIRHGEAVGQKNYLGRRSDPPLSEDGRAQVAALRDLLPARDGCKLFSSPMIRAQQTSRILFDDEGGSGVTVIKEFSEMDFGEWDGLSWREISARDDKSYRAWLDDPTGRRPPGGETLNEFNGRVENGLRAVTGYCSSSGTEKVFITAHGGVLRSILCSVLGLPADKHWSFKIDLASVSCVKLYTEAGINRPCRIEFLNLTAC